MTVEPWNGELRVLDLHRAGRGNDRPRVADLTARLGVERRTIQEDLDLAALFGTLDGLPFGDDRQDPPDTLFPVVPDEVGVIDTAEERSVRVGFGGRIHALVRGTGPLSLCLHHGVEFCEIDLEPSF